MPAQLAGQGFKNMSDVSHNSNFVYSLLKSVFFCPTTFNSGASSVSTLQSTCESQQADWGFAQNGADRHRGNCYLCQQKTYSVFNTLLSECVSLWSENTMRTKRSKIADLLQLKPWKTTSNILITICSTKKKSNYKKFGITPQLNNLNFLLHLEYYTPTALNEWNFRTAVTACLSFKALRQLKSSF